MKYYQCKTLEELEDKASEAIENGFVPLGVPVYAEAMWVQALVRMGSPCGENQ
jgi:hypothetical protein